MAIVHIAMFDAVNAIAGGYQSYTGTSRREHASIDAAIAQAAHDTLVALFPSQRAAIRRIARRRSGPDPTPSGREMANGIDLGQRAARAILALRADDGSQHAEPRLGVDYITSDEPGKWRQDPISLSPLALGAHWGEVDAVRACVGVAQFRVPPPPALTSRDTPPRSRR